jgi:hypothetical protein
MTTQSFSSGGSPAVGFGLGRLLPRARENSGAHDGSVALALASLAGCQLVDIAQLPSELAAVLRFAGDV